MNINKEYIHKFINKTEQLIEESLQGFKSKVSRVHTQNC